jgi:hypothetical protein
MIGGITKLVGNVASTLFSNTINDLRTGVDRHGGLARTNRFAIFMKTPQYSIINTNITSIAYGLSGGFIQSFLDDPRDLTILCESAVVPASTLLTFDYQDVRNKQKMPYGYEVNDIELSFIVTNDYYIPKLFNIWMNHTILDRKTNRFNYKDDYTTDMYIIAFDQKNIPNYICRVDNAFPINMSAMNYNENDLNNYQKITLTFAYEDFREFSLSDLIGDVSGVVDSGLSQFSELKKFVDDDILSFGQDVLNQASGVQDTFTKYTNSFTKDIVGRFA